MALPAGLGPGSIVRHDAFYLDPHTGIPKPKYLVLLAPIARDDVVSRLLTSRAHGRRENPPCYHGDPYPGFYLGVLPSPLDQKSWVDLRSLEDVDGIHLAKLLTTGVVMNVSRLSKDILRAVIECTAGAEDTTVAQERALRNQLARL